MTSQTALIVICGLVLLFCLRWLYADYSVSRRDKLSRQHKLCAEFTAVWLEKRALIESHYRLSSLSPLFLLKEFRVNFREQLLKYQENLKVYDKQMDSLSDQMELIRSNPEWNQDLFVREYFPVYRGGI